MFYWSIYLLRKAEKVYVLAKINDPFIKWTVISFLPASTHRNLL